MDGRPDRRRRRRRLTPAGGNPPRNQLVITRGLPASGKTTRARAWVAQDPAHRIRVNRDDMRDMTRGGWTGDPAHEAAVTLITHPAVLALLRAGYDVVCDDTNLRPKTVQGLREIAKRAGARFVVWDLTDVPVQTCIDRDAARAARGDRAVGAAVIRAMHADLMERHTSHV